VAASKKLLKPFQTFHLRASSEVERQRWVTALEFAKAKAIQRMESEEDENQDDAPVEMDKQVRCYIVYLMSGSEALPLSLSLSFCL
jgi:hypothetical protein